jgi:hypothetical protein
VEISEEEIPLIEASTFTTEDKLAEIERLIKESYVFALENIKRQGNEGNLKRANDGFQLCMEMFNVFKTSAADRTTGEIAYALMTLMAATGTCYLDPKQGFLMAVALRSTVESFAASVAAVAATKDFVESLTPNQPKPKTH